MANDQNQIPAQNTEKDSQDYIYSQDYKLAFGLLLFEFEDAVK